MGAGSLVRQWSASLAASLCVSMSGAMFVWMAPLMVRFTQPDSPIPMTTEDTSWLSAIIEISEAAATIPAGLLADRYGRKTVMLASGPIVLLSWIIAITTRSIAGLYAVRLIQGIALGVPFTVTPIYLAEIAEPKIRGQLSTYFQVFWYIGIVYSYATGSYVEYETYLYLACIQPVLFIICFAFVPESPYYLLMVNKEEEAFKVLSWLRAEEDISLEFADIKESVDEDMKNTGNWKDLVATKKDRMAFLIVQIVSIIKYMSGMAVIVLYVTQTLAENRLLNLTSEQMTILFSVILIVITWMVSFVVDYVGRRRLLIVSTAGSLIFHCIIAIYYYLDEQTNINVSSYAWISYISLLGFAIISNIGFVPLASTIQAEYFPSNTRGKGASVTGVLGAIVIFLSIKQYQFMIDHFGMYMNFVVFAVVSIIGTILFTFLVHETAGKSLGQIQKSLATAIGDNDQHFL